MNEHLLSFIGAQVDGTFYKEEGDTLIFSSNTFPSHRIEVKKSAVDDFLDKRVKIMLENLKVSE